MRLIDGDALAKFIDYGHLNNPNEKLYSENDIREMIDMMPTIDPVKHGHWIDMGDFEQCSVCTGTHLKEIETIYGKVTWIKSHYCQNCGAKMDEEEK